MVESTYSAAAFLPSINPYQVVQSTAKHFASDFKFIDTHNTERSEKGSLAARAHSRARLLVLFSLVVGQKTTKAPEFGMMIPVSDPVRLGFVGYDQKLSLLMKNCLKRAGLVGDELAIASSACSDAKELLVRSHVSDLPSSVSFEEEGLLALEWRGSTSGVLIMFSGDNTGSYGLSDSTSRYGSGITDFVLDRPVPRRLARRLARL
ncbi:hypothetical protein [Lichenicoccus sp.]|uniref:hypothetical protein n=1 Tax=Lichenicoccus sp. TaxID=2781899 RepID=UPI003D0F72AA